MEISAHRVMTHTPRVSESLSMLSLLSLSQDSSFERTTLRYHSIGLHLSVKDFHPFQFILYYNTNTLFTDQHTHPKELIWEIVLYYRWKYLDELQCLVRVRPQESCVNHIC